jgi:membrane glycosyltransferase
MFSERFFSQVKSSHVVIPYFSTPIWYLLLTAGVVALLDGVQINGNEMFRK